MLVVRYGSLWPIGLYLWPCRERGKVHQCLSSRRFPSHPRRASFGAARNGWVKPLDKYTWLTSLGSNHDGVLAHAAKDNDSIGIKRVHEEIVQTVSPLGTADGDKLRTGQVSQVANPSLDTGKLLKGSTVCVPKLKITLTAAAQGNLSFKFPPHTPEGESTRWVAVVSPTNLGLDPAVIRFRPTAEIFRIRCETSTAWLHCACWRIQSHCGSCVFKPPCSASSMHSTCTIWRRYGSSENCNWHGSVLCIDRELFYKSGGRDRHPSCNRGAPSVEDSVICGPWCRSMSRVGCEASMYQS